MTLKSKVKVTYTKLFLTVITGNYSLSFLTEDVMIVYGVWITIGYSDHQYNLGVIFQGHIICDLEI